MSESAKRRCANPEWKKAVSARATQLDYDSIVKMCENGYTIAKITSALGVTSKVLCRYMKNNNIKTKIALIREQPKETRIYWRRGRRVDQFGRVLVRNTEKRKSPQTSIRNTTHGLCQDESGNQTRLYSLWTRMKQRCSNPNSSDYDRYGGRGIKVCPEWNDYATFHKWCMENNYDDKLSIERNDVNGNYEPSNCCWIPLALQARNRRDSHFVTYEGQTKTLAEWSEITGIESSLLRYRLKHWPIENLFIQGRRRKNENNVVKA